MDFYHGNIASNGTAIGPIKEIFKDETTVNCVSITDINAEKERFFSAHKTTILQLEQLYEMALNEVGEEDALIFDVHKMMLEDEEYTGSIINTIESQFVNAEYAVAVTGELFSLAFANMDDEYMKERATDIKDISERLVNVLSQKKDEPLLIDTPCIILADDLTPSQTIQLDKNKVLGFVTRKGAANSHAAILARTMAVPAMVCVNCPKNLNGKTAIISPETSTFIVDPSENVIKNAKECIKAQNKQKEFLLSYKGKETITQSGKKINLFANIMSLTDVGFALQNDAEGIGLFRSEFLYLEQQTYPSEEMQFSVYKQLVEMMGKKKVIIRTLDIGADKQAPYFNLPAEENPALGYRAIRICLSDQELFKTQLRALVRASYFGNMAIMIPMVCSVWEILKVKEILSDIHTELKKANIPFGTYELGIMIETPASVLIAEDLAKHVDFFSIGTNDLTQYTLAVDRQNQSLEKHFNPHHPAIIKMIKMTAVAAKANGIWCGICGELAADTKLTKTFVNCGITELSVVPSSILSTRKAVCELE